VLENFLHRWIPVHVHDFWYKFFLFRKSNRTKLLAGLDCELGEGIYFLRVKLNCGRVSYLGLLDSRLLFSVCILIFFKRNSFSFRGAWCLWCEGCEEEGRCMLSTPLHVLKIWLR